MNKIFKVLVILFLVSTSPVFADDTNKHDEEQPRVLVVGCDEGPVLVPYTKELTILSAINAAGWWTEFASHKYLYFIRNSVCTKVNIRELMQTPSKDFSLKAWDVIYISSPIVQNIKQK